MPSVLVQRSKFTPIRLTEHSPPLRRSGAGVFCCLEVTEPNYHIVSLSGGKDSTALLLRMLEEGMPVDEILFCDTTMEFPQMYEHLDKLERYIGWPITRLKAPCSFEEYFYSYVPKTSRSPLPSQGLGWPTHTCRWCTGRLKTHVVNRHLRDLRRRYDLVQYIGIAADETHRCKGLRYPLVEWGMTESDCLDYCRKRGFDWGGLYDIFRRVSCWCCPLQPLSELRKLRRHCPELWQKLQYMDARAWNPFRRDYSAAQLELRFQYEELCAENGLPIRGRPFFDGLRGYLAQHGEETA